MFGQGKADGLDVADFVDKSVHGQQTFGPPLKVFEISVCAQSCPALCDAIDCSPPGFSVHGILQARILE